MDRTRLLNRRLEMVRSIDRAIYELSKERDTIMDILCHDVMSDETRRSLESDHALFDQVLGDLRGTKCILSDKLNAHVATSERPRLVRIK